MGVLKTLTAGQVTSPQRPAGQQGQRRHNRSAVAATSVGSNNSCPYVGVPPIETLLAALSARLGVAKSRTGFSVTAGIIDTPNGQAVTKSGTAGGPCKTGPVAVRKSGKLAAGRRTPDYRQANIR